MHQWYLNEDGSPKTHRRPRTCECCRDNPKGGCSLPFRQQKKVRWLKSVEGKPMFFKGLRWSRFLNGGPL